MMLIPIAVLACVVLFVVLLKTKRRDPFPAPKPIWRDMAWRDGFGDIGDSEESGGS